MKKPDKSAYYDPYSPTDRSSGSIAVSLLILVSFIAVMIAASVVYLNRWFGSAARELQTNRTHAELDVALVKLISHLASDPTPESDSLSDPVWSWIADTTSPRMTLVDVSSRIDPNWVRRDVFDLTGLRNLFSPDESVSGSPSAFLQQHRIDHGFYAAVSQGYGMLFSPKVIAAYLTPWGYANINLTDEFALQKLYEIRTGNQAASEVFHTEIQQLLRERQLVSEQGLRSFLGPDYDRLYPVVNALPWWNVHFLPALILRDILAYPAYHVKDPQMKAQQILAIRTQSEISPDQLVQIIGLPSGHVIYQYLGTTTWFWKATIEINGTTLEAVICRLPPDFPSDSQGGGSSVAHFRVVSRRYSQ